MAAYTRNETELIERVQAAIDSPGLSVTAEDGESFERHCARAVLHDLDMLQCEEA